MLINGMILLTAITITATPAQGQTGSKQDALRAIAKATYVTSGLDKRAKKLEKKYMPKVVRDYGGYAAIGYKLVVEKRISYEWTF